MRFHDSFPGIIGNEPFGKYKDPTHHPFHNKIISVLSKKQLMETFRRWKYEFITGFNKKDWLAVDASKVGQGSAKRCVDIRCVVRVIYEQDEAIGRLHQTIQNVTKGINILSATMGGMVQDLHNMGKEMEYYSAKLHKVDKRVEVSNMFFLFHFFLQDKDYMPPFRSIRLI